MAKKTSGQNPVDEAYLRSLMAGGASEPPLSSVPSTGGCNGENRETALPNEKGKADDIVNETSGIFPVRMISAVRNWLRINRHRKQFAPHWPTLSVSSSRPYKCDGRQGVYIDKELHQKISVIVGIAGKRQLTVGNYIDNVLKEHFEKHADEVKTYLQKSYNKIF